MPSKCASMARRSTFSNEMKGSRGRSEEHTSELQSRENLVCRLVRRHAPTSLLFPYTTHFRASHRHGYVNAGDRLRKEACPTYQCDRFSAPVRDRDVSAPGGCRRNAHQWRGEALSRMR